MKKYKITILFLSLAILVLAGFEIYRFSTANESNSELVNCNEKFGKLEEDYYTLDASLISLNDLNVHMSKELELFRNPDNKIFHLNSDNPILAESHSIICWNKKEGSIYISVENLPEISEKANWELWAMVNGALINLGPLPFGINGNFLPLEVTILNAENFLISLENSEEKQRVNPSSTYLSGNL